MTVAESSAARLKPGAPFTSWLWLFIHTIGFGSVAVFVLQGVRYQDCQLGAVISNGDWGPFVRASAHKLDYDWRFVEPGARVELATT